MSNQLVENFVTYLKAQGVFDKFRKECISEVDTKPAYQNLRTRVQGVVEDFHRTHEWTPGLNKNQLRDSLRKCIVEKTNLDNGISRIVEQVVNPKIVPSFQLVLEQVLEEFLESMNKGSSGGPGDSEDPGLGGGSGGGGGPTKPTSIGGSGGLVNDILSGSGGILGLGGGVGKGGAAVEGDKEKGSKGWLPPPAPPRPPGPHHHKKHKEKEEKKRKREKEGGPTLEDYIALVQKRVIPPHILSSDEAFIKWVPASVIPPLNPVDPPCQAPRLDWNDIRDGPMILLLNHKVQDSPPNSSSQKRKSSVEVMDTVDHHHSSSSKISSSKRAKHVNGFVQTPSSTSTSVGDVSSKSSLVNGSSASEQSGKPLMMDDKDFFNALNTPAEAYHKKKKKKSKSGGSSTDASNHNNPRKMAAADKGWLLEKKQVHSQLAAGRRLKV